MSKAVNKFVHDERGSYSMAYSREVSVGKDFEFKQLREIFTVFTELMMMNLFI